MNSLTVHCPQCNTALKVAENAPDLVKCKCPKCGTMFEVSLAPAAPKPQPSKTILEMPAAPPPPRRPRLATRATHATAPQAGPPPIPQPVETPDAPPTVSPGAANWVLIGGAIALFGFLSLGCVGVGVFAYMASREKQGEQPVAVANLPKDDSQDKQDDVERGDQVIKKADPIDEIKTDPNPVIPKQGAGIPDRPKQEPQFLRGRDIRLSGEALAERSRIIPFNAVAPRERLAQVEAVRIKGKATNLTVFNNVTNEIITWESLKRLKYESRHIGALSPPAFWVLIRDHGWAIQNNKTLALESDGLTFYQNFLYATILSNLIPLLEAGFDVQEDGESLIRGRTCFAVLVKRGTRPPMKLYFDKETRLLFKADFKGRFLDQSNRFAKNVTFVEFYFSDYRITDGINHWRKQEQWRDGKKIWETILSEVKFFERADDALFFVPGLEGTTRMVLASYRESDAKESIKRTVDELGPGSGSDFSRLVSGLNHKDAEMRGLARQALGTYVELSRTNKAAPLERSDVDALVILLKSAGDAGLLAFAIEGITRLGPPADQAIPPLLDIARTSAEVRTLAATLVALKTIGAKSVASLTLYEKHLDHPEPSVKDPAALALIGLAPDRLQLNRVMDLMGRSNPEVVAAADKLMRQKLAAVTRKDLPELRQGLKNPVRAVRLVYIDAIGSLKAEGREATADLTALLGPADKEISAHAVQALDGMGKLVEIANESSGVDVLTAVLAALKDKAAKTEETLLAYEKHLDHINAEVKDLAALAILSLGPERLEVDRLTELMTRPNDDIRSAAGKLLRQKLVIVTVKDLPALRRGLKSPVRETQLVFIDAIGSLKSKGKEAVPDLAALVDSPEKDVSIQASRALEGMGEAAAKAVPMLEKTVGSKEATIALAATQALCKIDPTSAVLKAKGIDILLGNLKLDAADPKSVAVQPLSSKCAAALLSIGEPAVMPVMKNLVSNYNPKMLLENRKPEATALRLIGYELLKEYAKQAKEYDDKRLTAALKKHELSLKAFWGTEEDSLASQARKTFGMPAETKQVYINAATAVSQAYRAISALRNP